MDDAINSVIQKRLLLAKLAESLHSENLSHRHLVSAFSRFAAAESLSSQGYPLRDDNTASDERFSTPGLVASSSFDMNWRFNNYQKDS